MRHGRPAKKFKYRQKYIRYIPGIACERDHLRYEIRHIQIYNIHGGVYIYWYLYIRCDTSTPGLPGFLFLHKQSVVASAQSEYNLSKTKFLFRVAIAIRSLLNETSTPRSRGSLQALYTSTLVCEFFLP